MTRISETDIRPRDNWVHYDGFVNVHLDDDCASGFLGIYDKVFLCKAYVESIKYETSQNYIFYIYLMDDGMDIRLKDALKSFEQHNEFKRMYKSDGKVVDGYRSAREYSNTCRIMENYLSEKCGWKDRRMILDINCKLVAKEDCKNINDTEYIISLFDGI